MFAISATAQKSFVKRTTGSHHAMGHTPLQAPSRVKSAEVEMTNVVAAYYTQASEQNGNQDNYYLVMADTENAVFNSTAGTINATNAIVAAIDLYAPAGTGEELPEGTYAASNGTLFYDADYSYATSYDAYGKAGNEVAINGDVEVKKNDDGIYTVTFCDEEGSEFSFNGTLSFGDMNGGTAVYPQIPTDINATFTGGMAFYHGNLMDSNTGNIYINLYDCDFDPETGAMNDKGLDLAICAFNRLFGDPKQATIIPGTYTVARNFKTDTYFPGMEIDYNGVTVLMGTYIKRRKSVSGSDSDYDYGYITDGTITITEGSTEGSFCFDIDCTTDRGHKVKGTAKDITFNIVDMSDDKDEVVESNLDHDITLDLDYVKTARVYYLGRENDCNIFSVDLGSPSGKDGTEGDILRMEFQANYDQQYLPNGTYELMENSHLWTNEYAPFRMTRGYFDETGGRTGTRYEHFARDRYCVVDTFAFVYSGRVGVEQQADGNYHFNINLADGHGFLIQGDWSGPMEMFYDPKSGIGSIAGDNKSTAVTIDGESIKAIGAKAGEEISVFAVDGQCVAHGCDATQGISTSHLPGGVYIVKVGNNTTTKIVKK